MTPATLDFVWASLFFVLTVFGFTTLAHLVKTKESKPMLVLTCISVAVSSWLFISLLIMALTF